MLTLGDWRRILVCVRREADGNKSLTMRQVYSRLERKIMRVTGLPEAERRPSLN